ncbi:hypothetical protein BC833DRAFT_612805, partial [Globomyces pollinis-pini]
SDIFKALSASLARTWTELKHDIKNIPKHPKFADFKHGVHIAWSGLLITYHSKQVYPRLYSITKWILVLALIVWFISRIITSLVHSIHLLFSVLLQNRIYYFDFIIAKIDQIAAFTISLVPNILLFVIRYIYPIPIDQLFFLSLSESGLRLQDSINTSKDQLQSQESVENPRIRSNWAMEFAKKELNELSDQPDKKRKRSSWSLIYENSRGSIPARLLLFLKRLTIKLGFFLSCAILSWLPIVGSFVWPLVTFYYIQKTFGMKYGVFLLILGYCVPSLNNLLTFRFLKTLAKLRAFGRELLEPYLCRSNMTKKERRAWFDIHSAYIYGFTCLLYPFLSIPIFGPIFFGVAQAAISELVIVVVHDTDFNK